MIYHLLFYLLDVQDSSIGPLKRNHISFNLFILFSSIWQDKEQYISKVENTHMSLGEYYETNEAYFNNLSHTERRQKQYID